MIHVVKKLIKTIFGCNYSWDITINDYYRYNNSIVKLKYTLEKDNMIVSIKYKYTIGNLTIKHTIQQQLSTNNTLSDILTGLCSVTDKYNQITTNNC